MGATNPLSHLLPGKDNSCCVYWSTLQGLALGSVVTMPRLEWSPLGFDSRQYCDKISGFQQRQLSISHGLMARFGDPLVGLSLLCPFASCILALLLNPPTRGGVGRDRGSMLGPVSDYSRGFVFKAGWEEGECVCIFLLIPLPLSMAHRQLP